MLPRSADDLTFIMTRNFPDVPEVRAVTVYRHSTVVKNPPGELVLEQSPDLGRSAVNEV